MRLIHVVGARPNFMKAAPVWQAFATHTAHTQRLVHTGQHYDVKMSDVFFTDLGLPAPDPFLGVGSGSHAQQTAAVMVAFEQVVTEERPDWVMVYGDVNSTVAAALVCAKLQIPVAHVEAGLRSFDRSMPEEINRLITDQIATLLLTPSADGDAHLAREGVAPEKIVRVGNVMIDSLVRLLPAARRVPILERLELSPQGYGIVTIHRPSNVDDDAGLSAILTSLIQIAQRLPLVFPIHPRTRARIAANPALDQALAQSRITLTEPLGYLEFLRLMSQARLALTDSGGIQEETSYLGVPCLTLRANTERPITVTDGTNTLVGSDLVRCAVLVDGILDGSYAWDRRPAAGIPLWDGHASERIVVALDAAR